MCRTDTAETAAVRASVMNRPSIKAARAPVSGSRRMIVARCVGNPCAVLPANTVTSFAPSAAGAGW